MRGWFAFVVMLSGCFVPDSVVDAYLDRDDDGEWTSEHELGTDCNDRDPNVGRRAIEQCDGIDNDCDGDIDEDGDAASNWYVDADGDSVGAGDSIRACDPRPGWVSETGDCNDAQPSASPLLPEQCGDNIDNDCDGSVDEDGTPLEWAVDHDGDGFGGDQVDIACRRPTEAHERSGDCDDSRDDVYPGAPEQPYDGVDADCRGDDDFDVDRDGWTVDEDCDDLDASMYPGNVDVPYDGIDHDCDLQDDYDADGDGHRAAAFGGDDCDDFDPAVHPRAIEVPYDGVDQDCVPGNDDDLDGDGVRGGALGTDCDDSDVDVWAACGSCVDEDGDGAWTGCDAFVTRPRDCDDSDRSIHPGNEEHPHDGIDQDCDGRDLTMDYASGLFVTEQGVDHSLCGTQTDPCATLEHASRIAAAVDKVLFVAEGTFAGGVVSVSVYGGLDPTTWETVGSSHIVGGDGLGFGSRRAQLEVATDELVMLHGLRVAVNEIGDAWAIYQRGTGELMLANVSVEANSLTGEAAGVNSNVVHASDVTVAASGASGAIGIAGQHQGGGLQRVAIEVSSADACRGFDLRSAYISTSIVEARCDAAEGAVLHGGQLTNSVVRVEGLDRGFGVWIPESGSELSAVTVWSNHDGVRADASLTVRSSLVVASTAMRLSTMHNWELDTVHFDADCLLDTVSFGCSTLASVQACEAEQGCTNATDVRTGSAGIDLDMLVPEADSSLIDAGLDGSGDVDVFGTPRPSGTGWDIGGVERPIDLP